MYITDWSDVDLGYWMDDYVGTDATNNFAYCYNGENFDPSIPGDPGYGNKPPVISHLIIKTDCTSDGIDNNNNSQIDEPGEQFELNQTTYYNNVAAPFPPATTNPTSATNYYNYMKGIWKDGSPFTYGGTAYGGTINTQYVFTGDPSTNLGWTEGSAGNVPGDRRILLSSGPFNFPANGRVEWGFALVFSQDTSQVINTISEFTARVVRDVKNAKYYDETHQTVQCKPAVNVGIKNNEMKKLNAMVYPNPSGGLISIDLSENVKTADVDVMDIYGRIILKSNISDGYRSQIDLSIFRKRNLFC